MIANAAIVVVGSLIIACSSPARTPALAPTSATLPIATLSFVDPTVGLRAWTMNEDGELAQAVAVIGRLGQDGRFSFRVPGITARLDADGWIVITGPERLELDELDRETMPGLEAALRAGGGTIRSRYRVTGRGEPARRDRTLEDRRLDAGQSPHGDVHLRLDGDDCRHVNQDPTHSTGALPNTALYAAMMAGALIAPSV